MKYLFIVLTLISFSCTNKQPLDTVPIVDLEKYAGKWYEIERFPNSFEKDLKCVTAHYYLLKNGKIKVVNTGIDINTGEEKKIEGKAYRPDEKQKGELKVTFFWPFYGDYNVIYLDEYYTYALVGSKSRKYAWLLSRSPQLSELNIKQMKFKAKNQGFDISKFVKVEHDCN